MKPRQPVFCKVPNPTKESKDEERQKLVFPLSVRRGIFLLFNPREKENECYGKETVYF